MAEDSAETLLSSTSLSPCSPNEVAIRADDCVEGGVEEWLEDEALAGFRVWQLAGIILSILLSILVGFCCCVRFRVPRTKQQIEADFIRKKITRSFRRELAKISNVEMDDMDLRKALHRVQRQFDGESESPRESGLRSRFHAVFAGMQQRPLARRDRENVI